MLNEDPRPDDLPDAPTGYAALPPDYPRAAPRSAGGAPGARSGGSRDRLMPARAHRRRPGRRCGWCSRPSPWSPSSPPSSSPCGASATRRSSPAAAARLRRRLGAGPGTSQLPGSLRPRADPSPRTTRPPSPTSTPSRSTGRRAPTTPSTECATMQVPVDYAEPTGERFTLALRKAPATDAVQARRLARHQPRRTRRIRGGVRPVRLVRLLARRCGRHTTSSASTRAASVPRAPCAASATPTWTCSSATTRPPTRRPSARSCSPTSTASRSGAPPAAATGRLHMSTTEVARDMDVMRVLLGDERLNFFGGSYGTFLGATTRTPSRRRSAAWCSTRRCRRTRPSSRR